jgi:tellurite resistance protein
MSSVINHQTALVYVMVIAALADGKLKDSELFNITELVKTLPIFHGCNHDKLLRAIGDCSALLDQTEGLEAVIGLIKEALPESLCETAYAVACDVVAADGSAAQEELRWLELLRHRLNISRLHAAAIERGSKARYARA